LLFYLALTLGLEDDPPSALERMVSLVEDTGHWHSIEAPIQMTIAAAEGESVWAFRYSSEKRSQPLYYSSDVRTLRKLYPERTLLHEVSDETRIIVSEPLVDLAGAWNEVPESSYCVVHEGEDGLQAFRPRLSVPKGLEA
jgi:predicted glutamine amidotransferase